MLSEIDSILVRPMDFKDIKDVVKIEEKSFATPWSEYAFECELKDNEFANYLVLSIEEEDKVVGYAGTWVILDEAHITNVAILPEYRGKKLGQVLMLHLMKRAIEKGAKRMTLEVRVSNKPAQKLYERMGFSTAGVRKGFYTHPKEDAFIMWADLKN